MTTMQQLVRALGNAGAVVNARTEAERLSREDAAVDVLLRHLAPPRVEAGPRAA